MATRGQNDQRPIGKNKDQQYVQTNIYLQKTVKAAVKIELLKDEGELSGLVESLLQAWLKRRETSVPPPEETGHS